MEEWVRGFDTSIGGPPLMGIPGIHGWVQRINIKIRRPRAATIINPKGSRRPGLETQTREHKVGLSL